MDSSLCNMCEGDAAVFIYILDSEEIPVCVKCYRILMAEHQENETHALFIPIEDIETLRPYIKRLEQKRKDDKRRI